MQPVMYCLHQVSTFTDSHDLVQNLFDCELSLARMQQVADAVESNRIGNTNEWLGGCKFAKHIVTLLNTVSLGCAEMPVFVLGEAAKLFVFVFE